MLEQSAFVYPGQRQLRSGEGAPWRRSGSWGLVHEASARTGIDLERILLDPSPPQLRDPRLSDLATFVLSMMAFDSLTRHGVRGLAHAGHGVGQYSALVAGGVLDFDDAAVLVAERSEAIAEVARSTEGRMVVATGLGRDLVSRVCVEAGADAWVASYNTATETVVAGEAEAMSAVSARLAALGARIVPVPAGCALHTPLMAPAAGRLREALGPVRFWGGTSPVCADVTGSVHTTALLWPRLLCDQLTRPVRWLDAMVELSDLGALAVVECGPRPYLSRLASRTGLFGRVARVGRPLRSLHDLDRRGLDGPSWQTSPAEALFGTMIINTTGWVGEFVAAPGLAPGAVIETGDLVGHVGPAEVRSRMTGRVTLMCIAPGERIRPHERIAWIAPSHGWTPR